jgi:hypothetical protein
MSLNFYLIANIITCVCAFTGFVYGIVKFFRPRKAVYAQMITFAVGCMAFGRLYQVVRLLTGGSIIDEFQLGFLGVIGSLVFFFSANFGLMDSLADDGSKQYLKYRIIPVAAPAAATALYLIFVLFADIPKIIKIIGAVITLFAAQSSYYNLKHLIFPDVDYGVINCLKTYNLLTLLYSIMCITEIIAIGRNNEIAIIVTGIIIGALILAIVPSVERGIKKWTI